MTLLPAALLFIGPGVASAYSGGIAGKAEVGCGGIGCHGGGTAPEVFFEGPAQVASGEAVDLELVIRGGQGVAGGGSVLATEGVLGPVDGGGMQMFGPNELTHSAARDAVDGEVRFQMRYRPPDALGTYLLVGAGNSVDRNGASTNDEWAGAEYRLEVVEASDGVEDGDGPADAGLGGSDDGSESEDGGDSGCASVSGSGAAPLALLLLLGLARRRR